MAGVISGLASAFFVIRLLAGFFHGAPSSFFVSESAKALVAVMALALCVYLYRFAKKAENQQQKADAEEAIRRGHLTAEGRPLLLSLGMLFLLAVSGFLTYAGWNEHKPTWLVLGGILTVFLLLAFYEVVRQILRPGPMLLLDSRGINHAAYGLIAWPEIVGLHLQQIQARHTTQSTLMLGVKNPQRYLSQAPLFFRVGKMKWRNDPPAYGSLPIHLNPLNKSPELIHGAAVALRERISSPMLKHWHPAMSSHQIKTFLELQVLTDEMENRSNDSPQQLEAVLSRVTALQPDIDRATQESLQHIKRTKRNVTIWSVVGVLVLVAWIAAKALAVR